MLARFGICLLLLLLAGCGGAPSPSGSVVCREPVNGVITIRAESLAFDTTCLSLPAGETVTIVLDNADSEPHNVAMYTDSGRGSELFAGEIIDGGESIEYEIPPLEAGTFYFDCTVHPAMNGSVVVS
ncbi:MAG: cupredoxin domain-containing protein [Candidatus Limnocylindria bacterium]